MKIKTNRVPLVGPRGRRELLDKIEELEKKAAELTQSGQKPVLEIETHAEDKTVETVLSLLKINGKRATLEELLKLDVGTIVSSDGYGEMLATSVYKTPEYFGMFFGFYYEDFGRGGKIALDLSTPTEPDSSIILFDI